MSGLKIAINKRPPWLIDSFLQNNRYFTIFVLKPNSNQTQIGINLTKKGIFTLILVLSGLISVGSRFILNLQILEVAWLEPLVDGLTSIPKLSDCSLNISFRTIDFVGYKLKPFVIALLTLRPSKTRQNVTSLSFSLNATSKTKSLSFLLLKMGFCLICG